jgi:carbonic anhydrase/acetyltransferase-like protein (isoleucine patch superfamily)
MGNPELYGKSLMRGTRMAMQESRLNVHPTAEIHPTAYLEGKVTVGAFTRIDAGTILTGNIVIGHHTLIRCNVTIRGNNVIGNYTHIYDNVNIEGGRPTKSGSSLAEEPDRSIIGSNCWINHGATMHGTQIADGGAVGLNSCCDYNTRVGRGAIVANGSATRVNQVIPDNAFAEGVPAIVKREGLTDADRQAYFGVLPSAWTHYDSGEPEIRRKFLRFRPRCLEGYAEGVMVAALLTTDDLGRHVSPTAGSERRKKQQQRLTSV